MFTQQLYDEIAFKILLYASIIFIVTLSVYSVVIKRDNGTYRDYGTMIWDLFRAPRTRGAISGRSNAIAARFVGKSKGEIECKRAIEALTGKRFDKCRPSFMRNHITGSNLELDCFNAELNLAVEYNGNQHYVYSPYFHKTKQDFYNLCYRDEMKRRLCEKNGIHLIIVPYTVELENIETYIKNKLRRK